MWSWMASRYFRVGIGGKCCLWMSSCVFSMGRLTSGTQIYTNTRFCGKTTSRGRFPYRTTSVNSRWLKNTTESLGCRQPSMIERPFENRHSSLSVPVIFWSCAPWLKMKWFCKEIRIYYCGTTVSSLSWFFTGSSVPATWRVSRMASWAQCSSTSTNGRPSWSSFLSHSLSAKTYMKMEGSSKHLPKGRNASTSTNWIWLP